MPKELNKENRESKQLDIFQDVTVQTEPLKPKNYWLTVSYQPVSLFSLKRSDATSMAARSNLVPTPCTIKMTLLKILLESKGLEHQKNFERWIEQEFKWIRDLKVHVLPPERLVVNRNGYKLRYYNQQADKEYRKANEKQAPPVLPMQDGFVFREWVYLEGNLQICCGKTDRVSELEFLFSQINYFGKRGCFFQYLPDETQQSEQPLFQCDPQNATTGFTVQPMDDLGAKTTFSKINPYSEETAKLDKDRVINLGFLPLQLKATSARYDLYERNDNTE